MRDPQSPSNMLDLDARVCRIHWKNHAGGLGLGDKQKPFLKINNKDIKWCSFVFKKYIISAALLRQERKSGLVDFQIPSVILNMTIDFLNTRAFHYTVICLSFWFLNYTNAFAIFFVGVFSKSGSSFRGSAELVHEFHGNSSTRPLHYRFGSSDDAYLGCVWIFLTWINFILVTKHGHVKFHSCKKTLKTCKCILTLNFFLWLLCMSSI